MIFFQFLFIYYIKVSIVHIFKLHRFITQSTQLSTSNSHVSVIISRNVTLVSLLTDYCYILFSVQSDLLWTYMVIRLCFSFF